MKVGKELVIRHAQREIPPNYSLHEDAKTEQSARRPKWMQHNQGRNAKVGKVTLEHSRSESVVKVAVLVKR